MTTSATEEQAYDNTCLDKAGLGEYKNTPRTEIPLTISNSVFDSESSLTTNTRESHKPPFNETSGEQGMLSISPNSQKYQGK